MVTPSLRSLREHPMRVLASTLPWRGFAYLLSGIVLATPTLLFLVLFPLLPFWTWTLSAIERRRVTLLGFEQVPGPPAALRVPPLQNIPARFLSPLGWREIAATLLHGLYAALAVMLGILMVTAIVTFVTAPLFPLTGREYVVGSWRIDHPVPALLFTFVGLLLLVLSLYGVILLTHSQATVTRLLIGSRVESLERQIDVLAGNQVTLLEAFEAERRRIERDLHDGPQQHLAGAALHLGLLRSQLDRSGLDPDTAALRSLEAAHTEIEHALDAIRAAVAGLRPQLLVDAGFADAIIRLAERSPIPTTATVHELPRLPAPVESSLYSIVSEFVTNSLKHSRASHITITGSAEGDHVHLRCADDGLGGADPDHGTGLIGIAHRVRLLHGTSTFHSPPGGPTVFDLNIPRTGEAGTP